MPSPFRAWFWVDLEMARKTTQSAGKGAHVRAQAAYVLQDVLGGRSLNACLGVRQDRLPEQDRALLAELSYGVCRRYHALDAVAARLFRKPMKKSDQNIHALVLVGLYQLLHMRIPDHATIGETAGAARILGKTWAVALVNGVLRRAQREREILQEQISSDEASRYSLPAWLLHALREAWPDHYQAVSEALLLRPTFTLRVNTNHIRPGEYAALLAARGITSRPLPGASSALMLEKAVGVDELPGFEKGWVSVQDAGAQRAAPFLDLHRGMRVLDACAAPGGKTGHILESAPNLDCVALDVDAARLQQVRENLHRLDLDAELVVADAAHPQGAWAQQPFERILLDVPCSGSGVLRRHPDIKLLRRPKDIALLVQRQREIMDALWPLLEAEGKMLYVTCSILPQENRQQIEWFLDRHADASLVMLTDQSAVPVEPGLQLLPNSRETDGFYYALLQKH